MFPSSSSDANRLHPLDVIERLIHGETAKYNDISSWKWQSLLDLFDANESIPHKSWLAETRGDLETILSNPEFASADKAQLLEVKMDRLDAPRALIAQAKLVRYFMSTSPSPN